MRAIDGVKNLSVLSFGSHARHPWLEEIYRPAMDGCLNENSREHEDAFHRREPNGSRSICRLQTNDCAAR
jgi:hypothetical protein